MGPRHGKLLHILGALVEGLALALLTIVNLFLLSDAVHEALRGRGRGKRGYYLGGAKVAGSVFLFCHRRFFHCQLAGASIPLLLD